jgi:hypothetical protein
MSRDNLARTRREARTARLEPYVDPELVDERMSAALRAAGEGVRTSRPTTLSMRRQSKYVLKVLQEAYPEADKVHATRPLTRSECEGGPRPCPFVSCKQNLFLSVNTRNGNIKLEQGGLEPWEVGESCALDVADRKGITLEEAGKILNLTRERVRQLEDMALAKLKEHALDEGDELDDWTPDAQATQEELLGVDAE